MKYLISQFKKIITFNVYRFRIRPSRKNIVTFPSISKQNSKKSQKKIKHRNINLLRDAMEVKIFN